MHIYYIANTYLCAITCSNDGYTASLLKAIIFSATIEDQINIVRGKENDVPKTHYFPVRLCRACRLLTMIVVQCFPYYYFFVRLLKETNIYVYLGRVV